MVTKMLIRWITIFFLLTTLPCSAEDADKYDFRKTCWGMTIEEVRQTEDWQDGVVYNNNNDLPSEQSLSYWGTLFGRKCHLTYKFKDKKLYQTTYGWVTEWDTEASLIRLDLLPVMLKKYGIPIGKKNDISLLTDRDNLRWETKDERTKISLVQQGNILMVLYFSREREEEDSKNRRKQVEKDAHAF